MANKISVNGSTIARHYEDAAGGRVRPVVVKAPAHEIELDNVLIYRFSPTGTSGNIDPFNSTSSGVTILSAYKRNPDEPSIADAKFLLLTAKRVAGTTAAIVDNLITVSINSVEVARLYIDASDEEFGTFQFALPNGRVDSRFNLNGGTNGRFNFAFTAADPSLEVYLEAGGSV